MSLNSRRVCKMALKREAVIPSPWETGTGRLKFKVRKKRLLSLAGEIDGGSAEKHV